MNKIQTCLLADSIFFLQCMMNTTSQMRKDTKRKSSGVRRAEYAPRSPPSPKKEVKMTKYWLDMTGSPVRKYFLSGSWLPSMAPIFARSNHLFQNSRRKTTVDYGK